MTGDELLDRLRATAIASPAAAMTTTAPRGLRSRLVHPIWGGTGLSGYVLTDGRSPKVADLRRNGSSTLTYQHDGLWWMLAVATAVDNEPAHVAGAVADCSSRPEGYQPADFWTDEELARLVVVELHPTTIEMARFSGGVLETQQWRASTT